jgi:hypothetical protein
VTDDPTPDEVNRRVLGAGDLSLRLEAARRRLSVRLWDGAVVLTDATVEELAEIAEQVGMTVERGRDHTVIAGGRLLTAERLLDAEFDSIEREASG